MKGYHSNLNLSAVYDASRDRTTTPTLQAKRHEKQKQTEFHCSTSIFGTPSRTNLRKTIGSPEGLKNIQSKDCLRSFLKNIASPNVSQPSHEKAYTSVTSSQINHHGDSYHNRCNTAKVEGSHSKEAANPLENTETSFYKIMQKIDKKQKILKELKKLSEQKISEKIKQFYEFDKEGSAKRDMNSSFNPTQEKKEEAYQQLKEKILNKICYNDKKDEKDAAKNHEEKQRYQYFTPKVQKQSSKQKLSAKYTPKINPFKEPTNYSYLNTSSSRTNENYNSVGTSFVRQVYSPSLNQHRTNPSKEVRQMRDIKQIVSVYTSSLSTTSKKLSILDFQLGKALGQGKFGTVFQAIHKKTNSIVALKRISKSSIKSNYLIDQFLLQVKIQSFCDHQNILKLYGCFDDREDIYLILEYMEEGTLFKLLKKNKIFSEEEAAKRLRNVAEAIKYIHEKGIAHRDIKPENIVISNGIGKLCDFGWATICTERRKTYCGTFDYAAPEILEGVEYDLTVDLWCLGVLAYELMVGRAPFYHISRKQTMKKILNVESTAIEFPSTMSKTAISFIENLIRKKPEERMTSDNVLKHPFLDKL